MKYCDRCVYLDVDEELQNFFLNTTKKYRHHICLYYKKIVRHMDQHPKIIRLTECDQYKEE